MLYTPKKYGWWRKLCLIQHRSNAVIFVKPAGSPSTTLRSHSVSGVTKATFSVRPKSPLGSAIDVAHRIGTKTQRPLLKTPFSTAIARSPEPIRCELGVAHSMLDVFVS